MPGGFVSTQTVQHKTQLSTPWLINKAPINYLLQFGNAANSWCNLGLFLSDYSVFHAPHCKVLINNFSLKHYNLLWTVEGAERSWCYVHSKPNVWDWGLNDIKTSRSYSKSTIISVVVSKPESNIRCMAACMAVWFRPHVPGALGEPPARLSFSPPLPETDRGEPQMERSVGGEEKDRGRSERGRWVEWTGEKRVVANFKKTIPKVAKNVQRQDDFSEEERSLRGRRAEHPLINVLIWRSINNRLLLLCGGNLFVIRCF